MLRWRLAQRVRRNTASPTPPEPYTNPRCTVYAALSRTDLLLARHVGTRGRTSGQCDYPCEAGQYEDSPTTCAACDASCAACFGAADNCTACDADGDAPNLYGAGCLAACPDGTYADSLLACRACDASCATCSGGTDIDCVTCNATGAAPLKCAHRTTPIRSTQLRGWPCWRRAVAAHGAPHPPPLSPHTRVPSTAALLLPQVRHDVRGVVSVGHLRRRKRPLPELRRLLCRVQRRLIGRLHRLPGPCAAPAGGRVPRGLPDLLLRRVHLLMRSVRRRLQDLQWRRICRVPELLRARTASAGRRVRLPGGLPAHGQRLVRPDRRVCDGCARLLRRRVALHRSVGIVQLRVPDGLLG